MGLRLLIFIWRELPMHWGQQVRASCGFPLSFGLCILIVICLRLPGLVLFFPALLSRVMQIQYCLQYFGSCIYLLFMLAKSGMDMDGRFNLLRQGFSQYFFVHCWICGRFQKGLLLFPSLYYSGGLYFVLCLVRR